MRLLIIEDEHFAAKRLRSLLSEALPESTIVGEIDSVEDAVQWLSSHIEPHLIFMDIQLADGLSFQIFEQVKVSCPVIFTTAYDEYALNAFKVNSIDYLLKPIEIAAFKQAIEKYKSHYAPNSQRQPDWSAIAKDMMTPRDPYKKRFLIRSGQAFGYLPVDDIRYFYSDDGLSFAVNHNNKKAIIDKSLDSIIDSLDPTLFYKISRKHIVALSSIHKIHPHLNNRLKIELDLPSEEEFIVSRDKVKEFKNWLDS